MGDYELLSKIKSPADVKRLDEKDLAKLCSEIREKLIETVSLNGRSPFSKFRCCGTYRGTPQNF